LAPWRSRPRSVRPKACSISFSAARRLFRHAVGNDQTPDFTPVASFPGLTPEARARLNAMKVMPARADMAANNAAIYEVTRTPLPATTIAPKRVPPRDKRVDAN
jgi:hypothetical protein